MGHVAHELMHVLGIWHMFTRDDRDNYITVDLTNVAVSFLLFSHVLCGLFLIDYFCFPKFFYVFKHFYYEFKAVFAADEK